MSEYPSSIEVAETCGYCNRTLLMGEKSTRFLPDGDSWVDVCALCRPAATERGWTRAGVQASVVASRGRRVRLRALRRSRIPVESDNSEPSDASLLRTAREVYNASAFRRTVAGIGATLGEPRVSMVLLAGDVSGEEVMITIAWDLSWCQYRVSPDDVGGISLVERGYEVSTLDTRFTRWNAQLDDESRIKIDPLDKAPPPRALDRS